MAASNLEPSLQRIFGHEGGYSSIQSDPGNWTGGKVGSGTLKGTKFGIAANSYPDLDIKNLTLEEAAEIYRRDYAAKIRFDDLPGGLDFAMLDFAINSGPSRAAKFLQRIVGVKVDGAIGPMTLQAVDEMDPRHLIETLCDERLAFLKGLSTWSKFGKGWGRRVSEVREEALKMASASPAPTAKPSPAPVSDAATELRDIAAQLQKIAADLAA